MPKERADRVSILKSAIYAGSAWAVAAALGAAVVIHAAYSPRGHLGAWSAAILVWALIATGGACVLTVHHLLGLHRGWLLEDLSLQVRLTPRDELAPGAVPRQGAPVRPLALREPAN